MLNSFSFVQSLEHSSYLFTLYFVLHVDTEIMKKGLYVSKELQCMMYYALAHQYHILLISSPNCNTWFNENSCVHKRTFLSDRVEDGAQGSCNYYPYSTTLNMIFIKINSMLVAF